MKKLISAILLVTTLSLLNFGTAFGADISVLVNNNKIAFPDQKPYIDQNNRTMVPVRFVSEALGSTVSWDQPNQTVTIVRREKTVKLRIGESKALVDGITKTFDTKAVIKNSRTMVPLRFISETFGADVQWIAKSSTVKIIIDNGYTIPADVKAHVDVGEKNDPNKIDITLNIDVWEELEPQFIDAEKILASKFGPEKAKEIITYARKKQKRFDEVPSKIWTINNQCIRVISAGGDWAVTIDIWQSGVRIS